MVTEKCLFVGLADGPAMLKVYIFNQRKRLSILCGQDVPFKEFIQSYNDRLAAIQSFLTLVKPDIRYVDTWHAHPIHGTPCMSGMHTILGISVIGMVAEFK